MKKYLVSLLLVSVTFLSGCDPFPQDKREIAESNLRYQKAQAETYFRSVAFCQGEKNIQDSRISSWDGARLTTCTDGRNLKLRYQEFMDYSL